MSSIESQEEAPDTEKGGVAIGKDGLPIDVIHPEEEPKGEEEVHPVEEIQHEEEEEKSDSQHPIVRVRRFATIMNLLNSMIGAGILSVPSAFVPVGVVPGVILLVAMAALSYIATLIVIDLQIKTKADGFADLAFLISGKAGSLSLSVLNLLFLITALVAYLILGGDMITSWFAMGGIDITGMWWRALMILVYACVFPMALTIPKNIRFLSYFSTVTVFCIIFYLVVMVYEAIALIPKQVPRVSYSVAKMSFNVFNSLSIFGLSFALPAVSMPIIRVYNPLKRKRAIATLWAIIIAMLLCLIPSIALYMLFGETTEGNVLKNFSDTDTLITVVRAGFFFVVSCAYPAVCQSVLSAWGQIIFRTDDVGKLSGWRRAVIVILANIIPLLIAMFMKEAKPVLAIGGALGGCIVDFVFPAVLAIKNSERSKAHYKNILCMVFAGFGIIVGILATYQAVIDAINSFKK